MGDHFDEANMTRLPRGGFFAMPAGHHHYFMASEPTVIQLHGIGPWGISYVNPEDDPRTQRGREGARSPTK